MGKLTARHIVSDIRNIATSGGNPNEFNISDDQILFWIDEVRSMLISQSIGKRDDISDSWLQHINCLEMAQADASECCDAPAGCYVLKSVKEIPATIDTWKDNNIVGVTTIDGGIIPKTNTFRARYQEYSAFTANSKSWYLKGGHLFITNDVFLEIVNISGLFDNPNELADFPACSGGSCYTVDSAYPVSLKMATAITDIIMKTKVAPMLSAPMDNDNDANAASPTQMANEKKANS